MRLAVKRDERVERILSSGTLLFYCPKSADSVENEFQLTNFDESEQRRNEKRAFLDFDRLVVESKRGVNI